MLNNLSLIPLQFITEPGKFRMNEVQGVGAAVTCYRRYLHEIVLDLVEADSFDGESNDTGCEQLILTVNKMIENYGVKVG